MVKKKSVKINEFIQQAASMHVLNTVYSLGLVVIALFTHTLVKNDFPTSFYHTLAVSTLGASLCFKLVIQYTGVAQKWLNENHIELIMTALNVLVTFLLLSPILNRTEQSGELFLFLQSFIPTSLFVLISPISWRKNREYYGFFGFVQWVIILSVSIWSWSIILSLLEQRAFFSIASNMVVLLSPIFLSVIRRKQMERLEATIYEEIYQDPLTKIPNRKCFYEYYDEVRALSRKPAKYFDGFVVFFVDIDHFKLYNDYYGHEEGDLCLVQVASYLEKLAGRLGLSCFRYGGEEFVLCGAITKKAWENILGSQEISEWSKSNLTLPVEHAQAPSGKLTLSAGAAFVVPSVIYESNAGEVTKLADHYLYKSKRAGRARLTVAESFNVT